MPIDLPAAAGRRIALIAHDNKKQDMLEWAKYNLTLLTGHELFATATTGRLLHEQLALPVTCFRSGPFGGDQQIGARIAEGGIDPPCQVWQSQRRAAGTSTVLVSLQEESVGRVGRRRTEVRYQVRK